MGVAFQLMSLSGHTSNVTAVGWNKNGKWLYSAGEDGTIRVWTCKTAENVLTFTAGSPISDVDLHPNQVELVSTDRSGRVRIWNVQSKECRLVLVPAGELSSEVPLSAVKISSDASRLVAALHSGAVCVWTSSDQGKTFVQLATFAAHDDYILRLQFSPDLRLLASASADKTVRLWNTEDWSMTTQLVGHERWVWDCAFSADSGYILTGSSDNTVRLWETSTGDTVRTFTAHTRGVTAIALHDAQPIPDPTAASVSAGAASASASAGAAGSVRRPASRPSEAAVMPRAPSAPLQPPPPPPPASGPSTTAASTAVPTTAAGATSRDMTPAVAATSAARPPTDAAVDGEEDAKHPG